MRRLLLLGVLFISQPVLSAEIADQYEAGAVGVKWGERIESIKKVYPSGAAGFYLDCRCGC